jgi:hypothetical protein
MIFLHDMYPLGTWIYSLMQEDEPSSPCTMADFMAFEKLGGQKYWVCLYSVLTRCLMTDKDEKPSGKKEAIAAYTAWMEKYSFATVVLAYESQRNELRRGFLETTFDIGPNHPNVDLVRLWGLTRAYGTETMVSLAKELEGVSVEIAPDQTSVRLWKRCKEIWGGNRFAPSLLKELAVLAENPKYEGLGEELLALIGHRHHGLRRARRAGAIDTAYASAVEWIEQRAMANPSVWGPIVLSVLLGNHRIVNWQVWEQSGYFLHFIAKLAPHVADENLREQLCMLAYRCFQNKMNLGGPWLYRYLPKGTRRRNRVRAFECMLDSFSPLTSGNTTEPEEVTRNRNREYLSMVAEAASLARQDPVERSILAEGLYLYLQKGGFGHYTRFLSHDSGKGFEALSKGIKASTVIRRAVRQGFCEAGAVNNVWRKCKITESDLVRYFTAIQKHAGSPYTEDYIGNYVHLADIVRHNLDHRTGVKGDEPNTFGGPGLAGMLLAFDSQIRPFLKSRYRIGGATDLAGIVQLCAGEKGLEWMPHFGAKTEPPQEVTAAIWHILTRKRSELPCRMRMLQVFLGSTNVKKEQEGEVVEWLAQQLTAHPESWVDLIWLCKTPSRAPTQSDWWWKSFYSTPLGQELMMAELRSNSTSRQACDRARALVTMHPEWIACQEGFSVDHLVLLAEDWWPGFELFLQHSVLLDDVSSEKLLVRILREGKLPDLRPSLFSDEILAQVGTDELKKRLREMLSGDGSFCVSETHMLACLNWAVRLDLHTDAELRSTIDHYTSQVRAQLDEGTLTVLLC